MIIDTHLHIWDLKRAAYPWLKNDKSLLNKSWSVDEVEPERKLAGIDAAVLVQASSDPEDTALMLETANNTDWICGAVCWLPLMDPAATHRLLEEKFLKEPYFKGVRHQIHDEKDEKWLLQPSVMESLQLLEKFDIPFDLVAVLPLHIEVALKVAEKLPRLRMVFDHLAQPPVSRMEKFGTWGSLMKSAAAHPNFFAKISGLGTASGSFENRMPEDIHPYIEFALQHFGVKRCFCGSDWPVSLLAGTYRRTWQTYKDILKQLLPENHIDNVLYSNAKAIYNLQVS
jgi:L-fuconolactonase